MVFVYMIMVMFMKGNGIRIKPMEREHFGMKLVRFILENFSKVTHTATEFTFMKTATTTKANG